VLQGRTGYFKSDETGFGFLKDLKAIGGLNVTRADPDLKTAGFIRARDRSKGDEVTT